MRSRTLEWVHSVSRFLLCFCLGMGIVCFVLLGPLSLAPVHAQEPIRVVTNAHTFTFGKQVTFRLEVESEDPIQSIVLAYRMLDTQGTTVEALAFDKGTTVRVEFVHQIANRYIRPFVQVTYWWTIVDAAGIRLSTEPRTFVYQDDRFEWETLGDDVVRVHWYKGDLKVAQQALDMAIAGLNRARLDVSAETVHEPIDVYLYASTADLRIALAGPLPAGAEALTLYETNVILVGFGPEGTNIPLLQRVLPHEVTHALLHQATQSDYVRVPLWLSEGLATSVQYAFVPSPEASQLLEQAIHGRETIPLNTLCTTFPADLSRANLAYVQSASVVDFIRDVHGRQAIRDLIAAYADGAMCEGGVQRVLGSSFERLEGQWLDSLAPRSSWATFWDENGAWVILALLFVGLPFLFIVPPRSQAAASQ